MKSEMENKKRVPVCVYWFSQGPTWVLGHERLTGESIDVVDAWDYSTNWAEIDLTPWGVNYLLDTSVCPRCGADMRGENE